MAASEGLLPSVLRRIKVSLDSADGDVGLRSFAASFFVLNGPVGFDISMRGSFGGVDAATYPLLSSKRLFPVRRERL
jgi:hypothetical protein